MFTDLPEALGFASEPQWWPLLPLALAGVLVALAIRYLPGQGRRLAGRRVPRRAGPPPPIDLPGIALAALAGLALGAVIGPEAPLIALGGGLAAAVVRLSRRETPPQAAGVLGATGSFAAISTLLGSPLVAAFLMMEASGLGGAMVGLVLLPGLLASGIGYLIFVGLDSLTGLGTFSLAVPDVPPLGRRRSASSPGPSASASPRPWSVWAIRWLALVLQPQVERRIMLLTPVVGLAVAGLAILYAEVTDKPARRCSSPGSRRSARS